MRTFHEIIWVGNLCWSTQHKMIEQDQCDQGPSHETMAFTLWRLHNSSTKLMWWWSKVVSCKVTNARTKTMSVEQLALREVYKNEYYWLNTNIITETFPDGTLPFRCTQVKKKGPLQTPLALIFFWFLISENVDVEILQRGNFEKKLFLCFAMGLFSPSHAFSGGF